MLLRPLLYETTSCVSYLFGDFASSRRHRVGPLNIDYVGKYAAVAPFERIGP